MQAKGQRAPVQAFDSTYLFGLLATTALAGAIVVSPARAADSAAPTVRLAQAAPAQATVAQSRVAFSIPAQSLGAALSQFGRQSGLQVTAPGAMTGGLQSSGVSGEMTPNEALTRLLSGTGLSWRQPDAQTIILVEAPKSGGATVLPTISVQGQTPLPPQAEIGNLSPEYAGGQVARGGKLGMLGNRDMMDTPLSQTSYTSKLIQDQQAQTILDVIKNDPSVRYGDTLLENFSIRGFPANNGDILFNGLPVLRRPSAMQCRSSQQSVSKSCVGRVLCSMAPALVTASAAPSMWCRNVPAIPHCGNSRRATVQTLAWAVMSMSVSALAPTTSSAPA
jgi:hypothetical protein